MLKVVVFISTTPVSKRVLETGLSNIHFYVVSEQTLTYGGQFNHVLLIPRTYKAPREVPFSLQAPKVEQISIFGI